jgi:hypothetical protein
METTKNTNRLYALPASSKLVQKKKNQQKGSTLSFFKARIHKKKKQKHEGFTNTKKNKLNEDALPTSMKVGHEKRK